MATAIKVLGQAYPAAATLTTLYAVPALTSTVCSTLTVCNQTAGALTYRVAVRVANANLATNQYLFYEVSVPPLGTHTITIGITLGASDVVSVYNTTVGLSYNLFGQELT